MGTLGTRTVESRWTSLNAGVGERLPPLPCGPRLPTHFPEQPDSPSNQETQREFSGRSDQLQGERSQDDSAGGSLRREPS